MLALWLPIVVSTVALFFTGYLSWMVLALHQKDWQKIEGEEALMDKLRELNIPQGNYMFPGANSAKKMNSPEHQQKFKEGPRGLIQMLPVPNMGKNLAMTFLFLLFCNVTFAYLANFALRESAATPDFVTIFRFVATIALLTFVASILQYSIWFKNRVTGYVIESVFYSLIAGVVFAALWPAA